MMSLKKNKTGFSLFSLILSLAVLFTAVMPVSVAAASASEPETVKVGFYALDGYHEMDKEGKRSGYGYDFFHLTQKYVNLNYEYVGYDKTWEETLQMLLDGEIDIATTAYKTQERMKIYDFSMPIGTSSIDINTRASETRFIAGDYSTYDGMKIGLLTANADNEQFKEFAAENGFSYTPKYYDNSNDLKEALQNKEVDAVVTTSLRKVENEKTLSQFNTQEFYAIVKKGNTELLDKINYAITQLNSSEGDWQNTFYYNNYTADNNVSLTFTEEEQNFIKRYSEGGEKLVIAMDNDWRPFAWKEGDTYTGILPEYIEACMELCGMNYTYYDYDESVFSATPESMKDVDLYACYGLPDNDDDSGLLASATLVENGAGYLQRKDIEKIKTLAIAKTTPNLNTRVDYDAGMTILEYPDTASAKQAVIDGKADAAFLYSYDAEYTVNQDRTGKLAFTVIPDDPIEIMAVMSADSDHTLMSILMKCINYIPDTQKSAITSKYVSFSVTEMTLSDYIKMHPFGAGGVCILVLLVIFAIVFITLKNRAERGYRSTLEEKVNEITELNEQLKDQQDKLEDACKRAEAANNAKTSFLFNMSHDIRTPMNAIIGFADLLEKHQDEPEKREDYLKKIQDSSSVLLSIINNVLEMARIEKGTLAVDEVAWSAEQFNDTIYSVFEDMMEQKDIEFTRQIDVKHQYVFCDPIKLREVFLNILSNAYKYTEKGGKVHMHLEEVPSEVEGYAIYKTTISDTGMGMSEDFLPHIFEEFSRENNTTDNKIEGTGLGMPIVKRLVEFMEGTIEVSSKKGEGSTFIVTIPHKIAEETTLVQHSSIEINTDTFKGKRILLAEDNDLNAEIAMEILGEGGFEVDRAEDGQICVDMLQKADDYYYDVILMDIQMPNMNGYEATKTIRKLPDKAKADIPILAMTANAFEEDNRDAKNAGMNGHLAKPIDVRALYKTLMTILA
jgi:signal transduction histidine kinase/BarA-like signal transduction histidine kinase